METAPQIDFQGLDDNERVRKEIERQIAHLEDHFGKVTACRVILRAPSAHHRTGGQYEINIYLSLPDKREVSVDRTPSPDERYADLDFAVNDAFKRARRQLEDIVGRMRGETKHHAAQPVGVVKMLMRDERYGFIDCDGREIYFHGNSVATPGFDHLVLGERVHFVEEQGRDGPQAIHVKPMRETTAQ